MPRTKQFSVESVLINAIGEFSARGYHGTSMKELVEGMGIGRGSIYDTFDSKRGLYLSALRLYISSSQQRFDDLLNRSLSPRTTIMEVFASVADGSRSGSFVVNAAVEMAPHDHEIAEMVAGALQDIEQLFLRLIESGGGPGMGSPPLAPPLAARSLLSVYISLCVQVRGNPDQLSLQEALYQVERLLNDSLP